jgi:hypothetical protein
MHIGKYDCFYWLTSTEDYSGTILEVCPEVVLGRYLAVTSVDGGVMRLTESQLAAGWEVRRGIGYSLKLDRVGDVPHQLDGPDAPGYDELYTFEDRCDLGERSQVTSFWSNSPLPLGEQPFSSRGVLLFCIAPTQTCNRYSIFSGRNYGD